MRYILVLAAVLAVFVFAGCVGPSVPSGGGSNLTMSGTGGGAPSGQQGTGAQVNASAGPFSAKDGLGDADAAIAVIKKNTSLVGISGDCGPDGKSGEWQYSYDSIDSMKGYVVAVPVSESWPRDTAFSTKRALPAQWVDSTAAVSACGHGGECSLETSQGKPAWTIISGQDSCQVDAVSGQVMG